VPDILIGDAGRLRQIVVNVLGNAIKFTETGEILLRADVESATDETARLHFSVADTGIGIAPEKVDLIFRAFSQADGSTTRNYGGTGLGLTICSRLVELMGGKIWVESEPGKGSTFHFTANFGSQHKAPKDVALGFPVLEDLRVLVVDDNATNRFILKETLASWRMKPTLVASGREALETMLSAQKANCPYGLVLLDCHMPDLDGFGVASEIKRHSELRNASIMMLTSAEQSSDVARCQELGIAAHLIKPIGQSELFNTIHRVLSVSTTTAETMIKSRELEAQVEPDQERVLDILTAEDNSINQNLAVRLLEKHGHRVVVAGNGVEAIALWESRPFDLILMDVQMPMMSGLEATAVIREREMNAGKHVPIVAMTAHAMKGDRERCLEAGMDDYIPKPIRAKQLYHVVRVITGGEYEATSIPKATIPSLEAFETVGVLDLETALARLGGDEELLKQAAEIFLGECPSLIANIRSALTNRDAKSFEFACHTLRGSIDNFGATTASELALTLEMMAREGHLPNDMAATTALEAELENVKVAVAGLIYESQAESLCI
jgi:CheY-like chemotaxis protein